MCRESYALPSVITPAVTTDAIPKSLYEAEKDDMNPEAHELIDAVLDGKIEDAKTVVGALACDSIAQRLGGTER